jgi:hypothetical protein
MGHNPQKRDFYWGVSAGRRKNGRFGCYLTQLPRIDRLGSLVPHPKVLFGVPGHPAGRRVLVEISPLRFYAYRGIVGS